MKQEPTWMESQQKQKAQLKAVPTSRSLDRKPQIQGHDEHIWFVVRLRIGPVAVTASLTDGQIYNWRTIAAYPAKQ